MLIYKKNGSDLVSAANYAKTVNLTGVVQGSGSFNSSGVCAINTTNINNGRTVIAQYNQTSNVAGHYHICTFNTQYSNTICLELFYGMHFNFRVDLGYRKQNPTTQQTAPSTGLLTNVRASMQVFSGN
jgi:hypothetical protein